VGAGDGDGALVIAVMVFMLARALYEIAATATAPTHAIDTTTLRVPSVAVRVGVVAWLIIWASLPSTLLMLMLLLMLRLSLEESGATTSDL
jgi:hypothetical protein